MCGALIRISGLCCDLYVSVFFWQAVVVIKVILKGLIRKVLKSVILMIWSPQKMSCSITMGM